MRTGKIAACAVGLFVLAFLALKGPGINGWTIHNFPVTDDRVFCFGDSLVVGIGVNRATGSYPSQLKNLLPRGTTVAALGETGRTADQALTYLDHDQLMTGGTAIVTLGGNDILKKVPWSRTEAALEELFLRLQDRGMMVVFTAVRGPLGAERSRECVALCRRTGVVLVPDILDGIINKPELMSDAVHPNTDGYRLMAEKIFDVAGFFITNRPE
ncbi:MAG: hypothetical protein HN742_33810 [Lentisphaerae bacterium]|jgi:acyl-CoA thioesterase I|nr:hypothetical protein [Lentisphaerota bacterium]MBT4815905.1 hypothetical protein [Lentisphaerota bacterium]MBT5611440.1 hypothetical protein [Lentisphaerota bacterium]MBT7059669.1 hypothetical protein [Lentisphaerota bacterium]MBT7846897.1 hypothetical protein [Lentisphaerota bacterium]